MSNKDKEINKVHIELLRLIAIYLVIYNHTRADGFDLYKYTENIVICYIGYAFSIFCKVAVPIFFMISGALLIKKEESIKDLFKKRILRIVLVILVFTLLQYIRLCIANHSSFVFLDYLKILYSSNIVEPYWYLKAYMGYLIALPFIRAMAKNLDVKGYRYLLIIGFVNMLVAVIGIITGYQLNVSFVICTDILFYPLLGHCIENVYCPKLLKKNRWTLSIMVALLFITVMSAIIYKDYSGTFCDAFMSVATYPLAMLLYISVKNISFRGYILSKVICMLGSGVFGVYLIEDVVRNVVTYRLHWDFSLPAPFLSALLFTLVSMVLGLIVIVPVKRIPFLNKFI